MRQPGGFEGGFEQVDSKGIASAGNHLGKRFTCQEHAAVRLGTGNVRQIPSRQIDAFQGRASGKHFAATANPARVKPGQIEAFQGAARLKHSVEAVPGRCVYIRQVELLDIRTAETDARKRCVPAVYKLN